MKLISSNETIEERFFFEQPFKSSPQNLYRLYVNKDKKIVGETLWDAAESNWVQSNRLIAAIVSGDSDFIEATPGKAESAFPLAMETLEEIRDK